MSVLFESGLVHFLLVYCICENELLMVSAFHTRHPMTKSWPPSANLHGKSSRSWLSRVNTSYSLLVRPPSDTDLFTNVRLDHTLIGNLRNVVYALYHGTTRHAMSCINTTESCPWWFSIEARLYLSRNWTRMNVSKYSAMWLTSTLWSALTQLSHNLVGSPWRCVGFCHAWSLYYFITVMNTTEFRSCWA